MSFGMAGRSTGGRIFAYEPVGTADGHASRAIVGAEAAVVVRRIFALAATGTASSASPRR
jgi:hypothetical protein